MRESLTRPDSPPPVPVAGPAVSSPPVAGAPRSGALAPAPGLAEAHRQAQVRRQLLALLGHEPAGHPPVP